MQEHRDPTSCQQVVVIANLSRYGTDFSEGGLFYTADAEGSQPVHVDPILDPGDAFLFHPQTLHGVWPVDPDSELDWDSTDGRWMFTSSLVSVGSLNGTDYAQAGQPA